MPLSKQTIDTVLDYCDAHLASKSWFLKEFSFINDTQIAERLALEFYSARYIYKLGEALNTDGDKLYSHVKFQIVQYASIYEAVIVYLLWNVFHEHNAVTDIEYHSTLRLGPTLPSTIHINSDDGEECFLAFKRKEKTTQHSIKFDDKVNAAIKIGFIKKSLGEEIKEFYKLRNAIHIESAVKKEIEYEIGQAQLAYRRMKPFIDGVKKFLESA